MNIIRNFEIPEQADLQGYLNKRGFDIPQATLSRRLKKLNVAKVSGVYEIVDHNQPQIPTVLSMKESDSGLFFLVMVGFSIRFYLFNFNGSQFNCFVNFIISEFILIF